MSVHNCRYYAYLSLDLSRATPPLDSDLTNSASGIVRSSPKISSKYNRRRSQTTATLENFEPYPPVEGTQDERSQSVSTITLPGDLQPEYKLIEKYNILSVSGEIQLATLSMCDLQHCTSCGRSYYAGRDKDSVATLVSVSGEIYNIVPGIEIQLQHCVSVWGEFISLCQQLWRD